MTEAEELEDAVLTHEFAACNHDQLLTKDQQQAIKDSAQAECDAIIAEVTTAHGIESQEQSTALSFDDMEDYLEELEDKLYDRAAQLRISFLRDAIPMYRAEAAAVRNRICRGMFDGAIVDRYAAAFRRVQGKLSCREIARDNTRRCC